MPTDSHVRLPGGPTDGDDPAPHDRRAGDMDWWSSQPGLVKLFTQFGFAGLVALIFYQQFQQQAAISVAQTEQIAGMIVANDLRAKEDRQLFREELKMQRDELRAAVTALNRAADTIQRSGATIQRAADAMPKAPVEDQCP